MLAMGRALMAQPRLLLLDEPSMGLAPVLVEVVFDTIRKVNEQGTTVLLVEQNALVALNIADHALRARDRSHHARGPGQGPRQQRRGAQGLPRRGLGPTTRAVHQPRRFERLHNANPAPPIATATANPTVRTRR